jgi:hypothetical protein
MEFAPAKNELLYFSRARDACTLPVRLGSNTIYSAESAEFLKVWLNIKLNWKTYVNKTKAKIKIQTLAFRKLAAFAWKTSVFKTRQICAVVIRSV